MLTDAELWEMRARQASVEAATLRLEVARAAQRESAQRIVAAHGFDPQEPYEIRDDGTIVRREGA